jgi:hypothetical protein
MTKTKHYHKIQYNLPIYLKVRKVSNKHKMNKNNKKI